MTKPAREPQRLGAGDGEVVDGAVDRQVADVAAREEERLDDVRVGREGEPRPVAVDDRRVAERLQQRGSETPRGTAPRRARASTCRPAPWASVTMLVAELRQPAVTPRLAVGEAPVGVVGGAGALGGDHQVPSGRSGVQAVPKTLHSHGLIAPTSTSPHWQAFGSWISIAGELEARLGVPGRGTRPEPKPAPRDRAEAAPLERRRAAPSSRRSPRAPAGCPRGGRRACTGSRPRSALRAAGGGPSRSPARMSSGSKPVTTTGRGTRATMKLVCVDADHRRDVTRRDERVDPSARRVEERLQRRHDRDVVAEDAEVAAVRLRARQSVSAVAGAVVSKPIAKKTTSRSGFARASSSASSGE